MTIYINNDTEHSLDEHSLIMQEAGKAALRSCGVLEAEIGVTFVDYDVIRRLNKNYRGIDKATDVLSFHAGEAPATGLAGDIFICPEIAAEQASHIGNTMAQELCFLTVHGVLHLCGYDHEDEADEREMLAKQRKILGARKQHD